jgi:hypothetical protein
VFDVERRQREDKGMEGVADPVLADSVLADHVRRVRAAVGHEQTRGLHPPWTPHRFTGSLSRRVSIAALSPIPPGMNYCPIGDCRVAEQDRK